MNRLLARLDGMPLLLLWGSKVRARRRVSGVCDGGPSLVNSSWVGRTPCLFLGSRWRAGQACGTPYMERKKACWCPLPSHPPLAPPTPPAASGPLVRARPG